MVNHHAFIDVLWRQLKLVDSRRSRRSDQIPEPSVRAGATQWQARGMDFTNRSIANLFARAGAKPCPEQGLIARRRRVTSAFNKDRSYTQAARKESRGGRRSPN